MLQKQTTARRGVSKEHSHTQVDLMGQFRICETQRSKPPILQRQQKIGPRPIDEIGERGLIACDGRTEVGLLDKREQTHITCRDAVLSIRSVPFQSFALAKFEL